MRVEILEAAKAELWEAVGKYDEVHHAYGDGFLEEYRRAIRRIEEHPEAWSILEGEVRRFRMNRYPYGVVYQIVDETILVVAVMHLHQRPAYWRGRKRT